MTNRAKNKTAQVATGAAGDVVGQGNPTSPQYGTDLLPGQPSPYLSPDHRRMLEVESGISPDVIAARGYRTITDPADLPDIFAPVQRLTGLLIPGYTPGRIAWAGRLRPDVPRRNDKRKPIKYEQPAGEALHLDVNPLSIDILLSVDVPIAFVEGEKKADALLSAGLHTVSLPGVYGEFTRGGVNPEIDQIAFKGRQVYVIFDSDVATKREVHTAERRLARILRSRGALVTVIRIPPTTDGKKQGADDYLVAGHSLSELLTHALSTMDEGDAPVKTSTADIQKFYESQGYRFSKNELTGQIYVNGRPLTDAIEADIRNHLRDAKMGAAITHAHDAMLVLAEQGTFNPVKDFIEAEEWDGQDHIGHMANFVKDHDGIFNLLLEHFLLGAIGRVYQPGAQNRMLVLVGPQGIGKSRLCSILARGLDTRYYFEGAIRPDDKDTHISLSSIFLWEVSELGATTRRADREALKAFITTSRVNLRRPFDKYAVDAQAVTSFIGTINDDQAGFLADPTGERRFMVCDLVSIDWAYAKQVNVGQMWAQAKRLYDDGERGEFAAADLKTVSTVNARFCGETVAQSGLDLVIEVTERQGDFVSTDALVKELKRLEYSGNDNQLMKDIADYMTRKIAAGKNIKKARKRFKRDPLAQDGPTYQLWGWEGVQLV